MNEKMKVIKLDADDALPPFPMLVVSGITVQQWKEAIARHREESPTHRWDRVVYLSAASTYAVYWGAAVMKSYISGIVRFRWPAWVSRLLLGAALVGITAVLGAA